MGLPQDVYYLSKKLLGWGGMTGIMSTYEHENPARGELRRAMPVSETYAYLDHAAVSPIPTRSAEAIRKWVDQSLFQGDVEWPEWSAASSSLRNSAAALLHCQPDEIGLIPNTTFGINLVAQGFRWDTRTRENVVVLENEFSSNLLPWVQLERRGVEVRKVPVPVSGIVRLDDVRSRIDSATRLVSASWVGYLSGYRLDLAKLCDMVHESGAQLFVDAIQGLGVFTLNTEEIPIDYLAADGHKWMLGPEGAGIMYVRQANLDRLEPLMLGWGSIQMAHQFQTSEMRIKNDVSRYEGGSSNFAGQIGLSQSLGLLLSLGCNLPNNPVAGAVLENAAHIEQELRSIGATIHGARSESQVQDELSGIVTFSIPGRDPNEVRRQLLRNRVVLSVRHGCLRAATHAYNTRDDIRRLITGISSDSQSMLKGMAT
jgi:cysteine desulfurase / selenocysteine lyase